jgi:hypothetical protein
MELGLWSRHRQTNGIPKLFFLGEGTGRSKARMALHEMFPDFFKSVDLDALFSGRNSHLSYRELSRMKDEYAFLRMALTNEIILKAISEGRL